MKRLLIVLICCMNLPLLMQARHIIGGEMTYECLGEVNGQRRYRFILDMYRDCASGGAEFDDPASIAIYRCGVDENCNALSQFNTFRRINIGPLSIRSVDPPDIPCLELPDNICVERARYVFEADLPIIDESYHVVYQRCCRNESISNIVRPGDAGISYAAEITPLAQQLCNNSPKFNDFPPTVICLDEPLSFDHSATDEDGDQLVYSFCTPTLGGGLEGTQQAGGDSRSCNGVRPDPPCPPPYGNVQFFAPNYNFLNPLGFDANVRINTNTGLITGLPNRGGQFVVGVCVQEFRNGELLSTLRRDFQFNVESCNPTVIASIQRDSTIGPKSYLLNSCGENTIRFVNESFQRSNIDQWRWEFDVDGNKLTSTEWNASITFPDIGEYEGILLLNPGTECGDTANIFVNIYPDITADFEFEYDTCIAGPVSFTDLSMSAVGENAIRQWDWNFGDGNDSRARNPIHTYREPGDIPVTLSVTDVNRCTAQRTRTVPYFPIPNLIVIAPSEFQGCAPGEIFFDNLSSPINESYDIRWDFGDGGTSSVISPTHTYNDVGVYTVGVEITSPVGCGTDTIFNDLITILPSPEADFIYTPEELSNLNPTANFFDQSIDAIRWIWDFDKVGRSFQQNPTFTFPDTGRYEVTLEVVHESGCIDVRTRIVDVLPKVRYHLPNAFTPNNDGRNEVYLGKGILDGITNFNFSIWNRYGEKIFETTNPDEGWNGQKNNAGRAAPNGVYICVVSFTGPRGERFQFEEFATLIR